MAVTALRAHGPHLARMDFQAMGAACQLQLHDGESARARDVGAAAIEEVHRIEAKYSRYREDSFLSQINAVAARGGALELDPETQSLLDFAEGSFRLSGGLFDITSGVLRQAWDLASGRLPDQDEVARLLARVGLDKLDWRPPRLSFRVAGMELDLGGIGKEYAADRAAAVCLEAGVTSGLVDLGGDIRIVGPHPDGSPWRVGVRNPWGRHAPLAVVDITQGALATSGDYERFLQIGGRRYGHVLNPKTGWPVQGLVSVSVAAGVCMTAGALASITLLMGAAGPAWLEELGARCLWVDEDGRVGGRGLVQAS